MGLLKTISNKFRSPEETKLHTWLTDTKDNQMAINSILNNETVDLSILKSYQNFETDKAWNKLESQIDFGENSFGYQNIYRIAAVGAMLLISVLAFKQFNTVPQAANLAYVSTTEQMTEEILPDGSIVYLDKQSNIAYDKDNFADSRLVKLSGRAFFEVEKSEGKNFVVQSEGLNVEVLGTKFEVNARANWNSVTVEEGKVRVYNELEEVILMADDKAFVKGSNIEKTINQSLNSLSWKKGILVFDDVDVRSALKDIEDHFAILIDIDASSASDECKFSISSYEDQKLESILDELELSIGTSYKIEENKVYISNLCN